MKGYCTFWKDLLKENAIQGSHENRPITPHSYGYKWFSLNQNLIYLEVITSRNHYKHKSSFFDDILDVNG